MVDDDNNRYDDDDDDNNRYLDDDDLPPSQVSLILYSPVSAALSAFFTVNTCSLVVIIMHYRDHYHGYYRDHDLKNSEITVFLSQ